ncbi:MAG: hypothetical protein J4G09_05505 [Proteobacteria bacterium]|nr:hypothetical protein [Pseudomonadota bacterium]
MTQLRERQLLLALVLIVAAAALRLLPHPANVTPIGALALFSGAHLQRRIFWLIPLGALLLGDFFHGLYEGVVMAAVYLGFLASAGVGRRLLSGGDGARRVALAVGAGGLAFWAISNLGIWWVYRPLTLQGLIQCYFDGLPYLARSLIGDAAYALILFGTHRIARAKLAEGPVPAT